MAGRSLNGGFNFAGGRQRPLIAKGDPPPYESVEQQRLFSWIDATARLYPEGSVERETLHWIHSIPNGAHVTKGMARRLVAEGLKAGILDVSCDEPRHGFHGLRIEMKRKGGRLSPDQRRYLEYLARINVRREICYSWQEAAKVIIEYLSLETHAPIYG